MQKVTKFLENYVEWVVLGIAVLFVGYVVYAYFVTPIVTAQVAGTPVTPADADITVANGSAAALQRAMDGVKGNVPKFDVPDFTAGVASDLRLDGTKPQLIVAAYDYQPVKLPSVSTGPENAAETVQALPVPPAATILAVEHGLSTLLLPTNAGGVAPPTPAQPAAGTAASAGGGAAAAPAPGATQADVDWVSVIASISQKDLADQWRKSLGKQGDPTAWKFSVAQINTEVLTVTLYRSEQDASGNWSSPVAIDRLKNNLLPAMKDRDLVNYAANHAADITTPAFWPQAPAPSGATYKDPTTVLQGLINPTAAAPAAGAVPAPAAAPAAPAGGAAGAAGAPGATPPALPTPPNSGDPDIFKVGPAIDALKGVVPVAETGAFLPGDPALPAGDLLLNLYDTSLQAGKTYRYSIDYTIQNPTLNAPVSRLAKKEWAAQTALAAPMSAPSPAVAIPLRTFLFAGNSAGGPNDTFSFDVYTWAAGSWLKHTYKSLNPGDLIGGVDPAADFSTKYTYVDYRVRAAHYYVTLLDPQGKVVIWDAAANFNDPKHREKDNWVAASAAAVAGGAGGAAAQPGTPAPAPAQTPGGVKPALPPGQDSRLPPGL
jgi:hypothetical protein